MPVALAAKTTPTPAPRTIAAGVIALGCLSISPAAAAEQETCDSMHGSGKVYQLCLSQLSDLLETRVRHALDKALMSAAEQDERETGVGYGRHVLTLDKEQVEWEARLENDCTPPAGDRAIDGILPTPTLICRITLLRQRLDALDDRD